MRSGRVVFRFSPYRLVSNCRVQRTRGTEKPVADPNYVECGRGESYVYSRKKWGVVTGYVVCNQIMTSRKTDTPEHSSMCDLEHFEQGLLILLILLLSPFPLPRYPVLTHFLYRRTHLTLTIMEVLIPRV